MNDDKTPNGGTPEDDGFRPYPPSNHPEDQPSYPGAAQQPEPPQYPQSGDTQGPGQPEAPLNQYAGYGAEGFNVKVHPDLQKQMVQPVRDIAVWNAVKYGYTVVFKRANPWLLIGLLIAVIYFVAGGGSAVMDNYQNGADSAMEIATNSSGTTIASVILWLLSPWILGKAVAQVDGGPLGADRKVAKGNYGKTLLTSLVVGILVSLAVAVPVVVSVFLGAALPSDGTGMAMVILVAIGVLLAIAVLILMLPLQILSPYYAVEHGMGPIEAMRTAWKVGRPKLGALFGFSLLNGLLQLAVILFTCGIGALVAIPQSYNAQAYMYRQISGGAVPDMDS